MVKVITIRDDVYNELLKLKNELRGSFSTTIEYLLKEKEKRKKGILTYAGSFSDKDFFARRVGAEYGKDLFG